jgi:hypothetical protein
VIGWLLLCARRRADERPRNAESPARAKRSQGCQGDLEGGAGEVMVQERESDVRGVQGVRVF